MTQQSKRPSLANFIKARSIEAARTAMAEGGARIPYRISERLNSALNEPEVLMRIKAASPQEREQLLEQLIQIGDGLAELDALPPDPEHLVFAAARAGFEMKTTPELLEALLTEGATTVTSAADSVDDAPGHAAQERERRDATVAERLGRLRGVRFDEARVAGDPV